MSYADIMAKVSHESNFKSFMSLLKDVMRANLMYLSAQSCHIGEEDEGGEEGGEEPSFEVQQTEMVWGGPGAGAMGVSGASSYSYSSCHALSEHVQNHCTPHTRCLSLCLSSFQLCLSFSFLFIPVVD